MSGEVEALEALLQVRRPLPRMGGWAIAPDFGVILHATILERKPAFILELGPGVSTLVAAYALERLGRGELLCLESRAESSTETLGQLRLHGLESRVRIVDAPLVAHAIGGEEFRWYATESLLSLTDGCAELLVVDGPPGKTQRHARYPALPLLRRYLADRAVILLDDAGRQEEREIVSRWRREFDLGVDFRPTRKGTAVITLGLPQSGPGM